MAQYLKPDCELGYIEDPVEIENLKVNNLRHTVLGCMLGDFDETGAYVIDSAIVKELIEMNKYAIEIMDNMEVCKSVLKTDKQMSFLVTFEGNRATLSLLEKLSYEANFAINSGTYSNINEYVLDSVETSGEINRNVLYDRWHIGNHEGDVVDVFSCDEETLAKYFGIVSRFKYLMRANKVFLDNENQLEEAEARFTNEMLDVLKHYPELEKAVIKMISETLNEKMESINVMKANFAKTFNELLNNVIDLNLSVLKDEELKEFLVEKRNIINNLNINRSNIIEIELIPNYNSKNPDLSPMLVRLKLDSAYLVKPITELAEEFLAQHKIVLASKQEEPNPELEEIIKLYKALTKAGLSKVVGIKVKQETLEKAAADTVVAAKKEDKAPDKKKAAAKLIAKAAPKKKATKPKVKKVVKKPKIAKNVKKKEEKNKPEPVRLLHFTQQRIQAGKQSEAEKVAEAGQDVNSSIIRILRQEREGVKSENSKQTEKEALKAGKGEMLNPEGIDSKHSGDIGKTPPKPESGAEHETGI